jgi:hypothetical protein
MPGRRPCWHVCAQNDKTERVGVAVTLQTHIREVLGTSAILTEVFREFARSLQENSGSVPVSGTDRFLPYPSHSSTHSRPYNLATENVIK